MSDAIVRRLAYALLLLALPACAPARPAKPPEPAGQTYLQALEIMCDVDRLAGLSAAKEPLAIGGQRTAWLAEKVENPDGIEIKTMLSVKGAADQAHILREAAKIAGIDRCSLADALEKEGMGGISP